MKEKVSLASNFLQFWQKTFEKSQVLKEKIMLKIQKNLGLDKIYAYTRTLHFHL